MALTEFRAKARTSPFPQRERLDSSMQAGFAIAEDFFPEAETLRQAIDEHFSNPHRHEPTRHRIWNYWFVPGLYTYLRTLPEKVFGLELARRFFDHLQRHAFEI